MNNFIIENEEDEKSLREFLGNQYGSLDEISRLYHMKTGGEVIDHRWGRDFEYTNVNAQDDPDFWDEESITK